MRSYKLNFQTCTAEAEASARQGHVEESQEGQQGVGEDHGQSVHHQVMVRQGDRQVGEQVDQRGLLKRL